MTNKIDFRAVGCPSFAGNIINRVRRALVWAFDPAVVEAINAGASYAEAEQIVEQKTAK